MPVTAEAMPVTPEAMPVTPEAVMIEVQRAIVSKMGDKGGLAEDTRLVADIGLDSVALMDLVADLEDRFRLALSDQDLAGITTVGDVVRAIEARLRSAGAENAEPKPDEAPAP